MKKQLFFLVLTFFVAMQCVSQQQKMSALTQYYLNSNKYLSKNNGYLKALILVKNNINENSLLNLGVIINTKAGNVWSVQIPYSKLQQVALINEVDFIETSIAAQPLMRDSDWVETKTNLVHQGFNLPMAYKGKNVVVGIIDIGFDYNNPSFFDEQGNCRIKRVWEQNKLGTPPTGYNYGNELSDVNAIKIAETDRISDSHGTMVAGIAAGTGILSKGNINRGVAPEADLVLVGLEYGEETFLDDKNTASASFIDAIDYIFKYAASQNKPAVINISWGHHAGAHDGTSLLDKAIENLTGKGKILVNAAGNEGKQQLHFNKSLNNDTFNTYSLYSRKINQFDINTTDFWGSENSDFSLQIKVSDSLQNIVAASNFIAASTDSFINGKLNFGNDSLTFSFACLGKNPVNNKPEIFVTYKNSNNSKYFVSYAFTASNTELHAWNCGYEWYKGYPVFASTIFGQTTKPNFINGDNLYCNGESGSNSKASISVGSYNANVGWINFWGGTKNIDLPSQKDTITGFSSRGPTTDNRTKPDITGPGYFVGGPASSFTPFDITDVTDTFYVGAKRYDWIMSAGTSFSAPCVTGAVALMLEADHFLTPNKVLNILKNTARNDAKTGVISTNGNNNWGWGKIDVYEAVKLSYTTSVNEYNLVENKPFIYPNPFENIVYLTNIKKIKNIAIFNTTGKLVYENNSMNENVIDLSFLPNGIYIIKAFSEEKIPLVQKLIKH